MTTFWLVSSTQAGGISHYVAYTQDELYAAIADIDKHEIADAVVQEMVRFEVGDHPPPAVVEYHAIYKDETDAWQVRDGDTLQELDDVTAWAEGREAFYATGVII